MHLSIRHRCRPVLLLVALAAVGAATLGGDAAASMRIAAAGGPTGGEVRPDVALRSVVKQHLLQSRRDAVPKPRVRPGPAPTRPQPRPSPSVPRPAAQAYGVSLDNPEYLDAATRNRELDAMAAMGARWVRFDVKWSDVQWDGPTSFNWSKYDALVDAARARGLQILADLAYSPTWARPGGTSDKFGPDTEPRRRAFATFAEAAVRHFAGRVSHWEIWNEPNGTMFWAPQPNASHYTALLRAAYRRIKAVDPSAYVLAGGTTPAPTNGVMIDEVDFLAAVYENGGKDSFDGWSHHPYTVSPTFKHRDNAWYQMAGTSQSIRSVMTANGDAGKQVWGTEFGPPTSGSPNAMSEADQARQITEAYRIWRGYGWTGALFVYAQRDKSPYGASGDSFNYHGMLRFDFSQKPAWAAYRASAAA